MLKKMVHNFLLNYYYQFLYELLENQLKIAQIILKIMPFDTFLNYNNFFQKCWNKFFYKIYIKDEKLLCYCSEMVC